MNGFPQTVVEAFLFGTTDQDMTISYNYIFGHTKTFEAEQMPHKTLYLLRSR